MPPLVLITFAFGVGAALTHAGVFITTAGGLAAAFIFLAGAIFSYWRGRRETPLFLLLCFGFGGYTWAALHQAAVLPPELEPFLTHYVKIQGTIAGRPVIYANRAVFTVKDPSVALGREAWRGPAKVQIVYYFPVGRDAVNGPPEVLQEGGGREGDESGKREKGAVGIKKLLPGDRVMVQGRFDLPPKAGNPGDFDYRDYLARRGIVAQIKARSPPVVLESGRPGARDLLPRLFAAARLRVARGIDRFLPQDQASFLKGILLGAKEEITPEDRDVYRRTGVMHLFAVSGLHLGFVLFFFLSLAGLLRSGRGFTFFLAAAGLLSYAALIGFPPSAARASVMGLAGTAAYLWHRRKDLLASLALAAFVMLVFNPGALFEPGFQLSFAAAWGIIYLAGPLGLYLPLPRGWKEVVTVPLAAQLALLPLLALYFQQVPFLSLIANILVVPVAGLVVNLGLAGMILALLHQGLAGPFFIAAGALTLPVQGMLDLLARVPGGTLAAPAPSWLFVAAWFALLTLFGWSTRSGIEVSFPHFRFRAPARRWLLPSLLGLILAAFCLYWGPALGGAPGLLRVTFLNVGQGDCILVETPGGGKMLVDGGGKPAFSSSSFDPGREVVVPYLARRGIRRLDLAVNSHPHEDHLGGLLAVFENVKVKEAVAPPVAHPTPLWLKFEALLEEKGIPLHRVRAGAALRLDPEVEMRVLHPPLRLLTGTRSDLNNNSLVLHIRYGKIAFLLAGDIEKEGMAALVAGVQEGGQTRELFPAAVLKAPHHGSTAGIDLEFARLVRPQVVVISVGPNPFGHPSPEFLKFWQEQKATVLRTDSRGAITFETDGKELFLKTGYPGHVFRR